MLLKRHIAVVLLNTAVSDCTGLLPSDVLNTPLHVGIGRKLIAEIEAEETRG